MNLVPVQELCYYSFSQYQSWFRTDEDTTQKIINSLIVKNILKKPSREASDNEEVAEDIFYDMDEQVFAFKCVGIIIREKTCFFVYPKYIDNIKDDKENGYAKFKQIISVIENCEKIKKKSSSLADYNDNQTFDKLVFTIELLKDYYENGIYLDDRKVIEENGAGEILWEKTINDQNAYFSNEVPVYLDLYTVNNAVNEDSIFTRLHSCVLSRCCEEMQDILEFLDLIPVSISDEQLDNFGNAEYLTQCLEQELRTQFVTSKQEILKKLLTYINKKEIYNKNGDIYFVGTNSFNLVWEDVCAKVMGNRLDKTLEQLKLKIPGDAKETDRLQDLIPKPQWKPGGYDKIHEKNTLEPDLISLEGNIFHIYDAKYYKIQLDEKGVNNQPGIGDITKQYLYAKPYMELADENNLMIKNTFLMPYDGMEEVVLGEVSISLFDNMKPIEIILKPCEKMFSEYLKS